MKMYTINDCILSLLTIIRISFTLRKLTTSIESLRTSNTQTHSPSVMIKSGRLHPCQHCIQLIPELNPFQSFHDLQENTVAIFIPEDFDDLLRRKLFKSVVDTEISPVCGYALEEDIVGELPD